MGDESVGSALARWRSEALTLDGDVVSPRAPLYAVYEEALELARFHARYWSAQRDADGRLLRRGLEQAVGGRLSREELNEETGDELRSLLDAVHEAHVAYLLRTDPLPKSPAERGRFVLTELTAALEWLFDEGEEPDEPKHGRAALAREDEPETVEALAGALEDYAKLAEPYRDVLDGLGGFDAELIDEARAIAETLRAAPTSPPSAEAVAALALRSRLLTLLLRRMHLVRAAARFVFRDDPDILREATSTYERKARAAARRAAARRSSSQRAPAPESGAVERSTAL